MKLHLLSVIIIVFINFLLPGSLNAQQLQLRGTVYDYFSKRPLDAVTVQTTTGYSAITDSSGKFIISVFKKDSVWFSYLFKQTHKYPIDTIADISNFEIALHVDAAWLPAVKVKNSNYKLDSLQNRTDYAKVFNFRKPGIRVNTTSPSSYVPGSVTAGLDLTEFINMFRFRRNRQILTMQERLIEQEQEKYIKHRYTKYFVQKLTSLKGAELDSFISISKPSYDLLTSMNDLELGYYIQQIFKLYRGNDRDESPLWIRKPTN